MMDSYVNVSYLYSTNGYLKKGTNLIIMSHVKNPFTLVRSPVAAAGRRRDVSARRFHRSRFMCDK